jgi:kinesin family protein 26
VRVLLRLSGNNKPSADFVQVCPKGKQVILSDPMVHIKNHTTSRQIPQKKTFDFDAVFQVSTPQSEVCQSSLVEVLHSVLTGTDGCILSYGQAQLGKTSTMVGQDDEADMYGVIPTGIVWLFKLIKHLQQKTKCDFTIGVSALEVNSLTNQMSDLLTDNDVGSSMLPHSLSSNESFSQKVFHVMSLEAAAYYFDCALQAWKNVKKAKGGLSEAKHSSFCFTMHVLQKMTVSNGENVAQRSRLSMWDLGSCDQIQSISCKGKTIPSCDSLLSVGGVLVALLNKKKCIPHIYRENKLTKLLQESVVSASCHTTLIVHISSLPQHYCETLHVLELLDHIHKRKQQQRSRMPETSSFASRRTQFSDSVDIDGSCYNKDEHSECSQQQQLLTADTDQLSLSNVDCFEGRTENIKSMASTIDSSHMNSKVLTDSTMADEEQHIEGLNMGACTVDTMTSSERVSAAESYMVVTSSLNVQSVAKANTAELPHNSTISSEKEERGDPAGQSDSAGHSPSPSPKQHTEKSLGKSMLLPVDEHSHLSLSHPHYQELTEYVDSLLQHSPKPPLLSPANQRKRTTRVRLPSGNSLTFTPSLTQQQIAGERDDSTVDNTAVLSNPSSKASAYCHNVSDSPYSHINNENSHECSTTTAGAGTLTSLLDQLLTFGSMDGFAIKEGSLGTVATGGSYKRGHRVDAPFIRSLSARYPHKRKINESTLKQYGGSFSNHKRSYSLSGAAGKSQDVEVHTVPDLAKYSFENLRPDKLDAKLRKRQAIQCKVSKLSETKKQNYSAKVAKGPTLHRSLSTQSAPIKKLALNSNHPFHNEHSEQRCPANNTNDEVALVQ